MTHRALVPDQTSQARDRLAALTDGYEYCCRQRAMGSVSASADMERLRNEVDHLCRAFPSLVIPWLDS